MIVICRECGLKYQIDPGKIKGDRARMKCKGCSAGIIITSSASADTSSHPSLLSREEEDYEAIEERVQGSLAAEIQKRSGIRLTTKAILLMLVVSLVPLFVYILLSVYNLSSELERDTNNSGQRAAKVISSEVNVWLTQNITALKMLAQQHDMQSMDRYRQGILLKALQKEYPWITFAFTTDLEGLNIARSDDKGLKDFSNRSYVKDITIEKKDMGWRTLIGRSSRKPSLVLSVPIEVGGETVGVLGASMSREAISQIISEYRKGDTGKAFLVDESGRVLAHANNEFVMNMKDFNSHGMVKAGRDNIKRVVEFTGDDNKEYLGFAHGTDLGWMLILQQEKEEAYRALHYAKIYACILVVLTVIAVAVIAYYAARSITRSLVSMTEAAHRVANGESGVEIASLSTDEVGDLADAINRMQESLSLSIRRLQMARR